MSMARLKQIFRARNIHGLLLPPKSPDLIPDWGDFPWDEFCAVRFGHSLQHPSTHLVASDQMSEGVIAFENIRKLGYRRVGLVTNQIHSKNPVRFAAGYLLGNLTVPEADRLPPLILSQASTREDEKSLLAWLKNARPDAIFSDLPHLREMLGNVGYRVPRDVAIAAMSVLDGNADAGIDQNSEEIGRVAVQVLVSLINRNERGLPKVRREILIEGCWVDGSTMPSKKKVLPAAPKNS
jgi:DNA-binding LacI/PurR family transcriptional regulator